MRLSQNKSRKFVRAPFFCISLTLALIFSGLVPAESIAQEIDLDLPPPSKIKAISKPFNPAIIRAVTVNPNDPFLFDFIIDRGDTDLDPEAFEAETQKLVKYFLAALTIPEADLWVNLSPYEQDSMVSPVLGVTELGKDLLIKDYYLKQVTAQLTNPNTPTGKKFWDLAYKKAKELYGNTNVPINTFSKVWIVPDQATVLEKDGSAFIAESHLKVFLDQDYLAIKENLNNKDIGTDRLGNDKTQDINGFSAGIMKEVVLPEIEKEVNAGENFAAIRQIYASAILATWYKARLKESLLGKLYADQNKVAGVDADDPEAGEKIFEKYTAALKTGAYNIIKQDYDLSTQKIVQRKYFSGGVRLASSAATKLINIDNANVRASTPAGLSPSAARAVSTTVQQMQAGETEGLYRKSSPSLVVASVRVASANSGLLGGAASLKFVGDTVRSDIDLKNLGVVVDGVNLGEQAPNVASESEAQVPALLALGKASPAQVEEIARRSGYSASRLMSWKEDVKKIADKVRSTMKVGDRSSVYWNKLKTELKKFAARSFGGSFKNAMPDTLRSNLVVSGDRGRRNAVSLDSIRGIDEGEFESIIKELPAAERRELTNIRRQLVDLKPGETTLTFMTSKSLDGRLLDSFYSAYTSRSRQSLSERIAIADAVVKNRTAPYARVALTAMGYQAPEIDRLLSPNGSGDLEVIARRNPTAFLEAAKVSPTIPYVLYNIANPYGGAVTDENAYDKQSTDYYAKLMAERVPRAWVDRVVKLREALKRLTLSTSHDNLLSTLATTPYSAYSRDVGEFVDMLERNPEMMHSFIEPASLGESDTMQIYDAAEKMIGMLKENPRGLLTVVRNNVNFTTQQQDAVLKDLKIAGDLRELNGSYPIFTPRNGAALAEFLSDEGSRRMVLAARASSSTSNVNALLAAHYVGNAAGESLNGYYSEIFAQEARSAANSGNTNYKPLSNEEVGLLTKAAIGVAKRNPYAFRDPTEFERAVIEELKGFGIQMERAVSLSVTFGQKFDVNELARLRQEEYSVETPGSTRLQENTRAVAGYLHDVFVSAYVRSGRVDKLPALQGKEISRRDIESWVRNPSLRTDPTAKAFFRIPEVARVAEEISPSFSDVSISATRSFGKTLESVRGSTPQAVGVRLGKLVREGTSPEEIKLLAEGLVGLAQDTARAKELEGLGVPAARGAIAEYLKGVPGVSPEMARKAASRYTQNVGGIDLSADAMDLKIKRDGNGVVLPIADQDIENLRIDGLTPIILDVQPATPASVPFLMNLVNTPQAK